MESLDQAFAQTSTGEVMHTLLVTCESDTPLAEIAHRMAQYRVHCVLVMDADDDHPRAPWAIVSDLDLAAAAANGLNGKVARDIAATPIVTLDPSEPLWRAAQLMAEHANAHLVVIEAAGHRPVGIVSTLDVARVAGAGHFDATETAAHDKEPTSG